MTPLLDQLIWPNSRDGKLTTKTAFSFFHRSQINLVWPFIIWCPCIPPSHSFIFWRLMHRKLPTNENLQRRGCTFVYICVLCYTTYETSSNLFLTYGFVKHLWRWLENRLHCSIDLNSTSGFWIVSRLRVVRKCRMFFGYNAYSPHYLEC